jgi:HSP20 family protein
LVGTWHAWIRFPRQGVSVLRTLVVRPEWIGTARLSPAPCRRGDSERIGGEHRPPTSTSAVINAIRTMLTRRSSSPFELFDRLEQQLSQQLQTAERVPAAEVRETPEAYEVVLELPGVDKAAIEVKATDRTLVISAERRNQHQLAGPTAETTRGPLLSEFRYGTWSRSFRFPVAIEREQLQAVYRDGLLHVSAPKANTVSTVTVKVEG